MKVKGKVERVGGGRGTRRCYSLYKLGPPARGAQEREIYNRHESGERRAPVNRERAKYHTGGRRRLKRMYVLAEATYTCINIFIRVWVCVCVHTRANVTYATRIFCNEGDEERVFSRPYFLASADFCRAIPALR